MKLSFLSGGAVTPSASPMPPKVASEAPKVEAPKVEAPKVEAPVETPKVEVPEPKIDAPKAAAPVMEPEEPKAEPAPEEKPKKSEAPKRRTISAIKAPVSIENIVSNTVDVKEAVPENLGDGTIPDDETLKAKWVELANLYSDRPRLANTLSTAVLEFSEEDGYKVITFKVQNESQRAWIEEKLIHSLEDKFCKLINCGKIWLHVSVIPDTQVQKKIYMPEDKAKDLMKQNDQVKNLVKDLDLGIK
jgi:hypothetical protein